MTWQSELLASLSRGNSEASAAIVIRQVVQEQKNGIARQPALIVHGEFQDDEVVFSVRAPGGRSWTVGRPLLDLAEWARSRSDFEPSLLAAVASSVTGTAHWDDEEWIPFGYVGTGSMPHDLIRDIDHHVSTDRDDMIVEKLAGGLDVLVVGPPASGKTLSILTAAQRRQSHHEDHVIWLDLTEAFDNAEAMMLAFLKAPRSRGYLVVVDNLQANVTATYAIFDLITRLRDELDLPVRTLATCWPSAHDLVLALPVTFTRIAARGTEVIHMLLAESRQTDLVATEFDELSGGDVLLAKSALKYFQRRGRMPDDDELAETIAAVTRADQVMRPETRRTLYWFASLGGFEIGVYRMFCETEGLAAPVSELLSMKLITCSDEVLSIGHPSKAAAIVRYAVGHWNDPEHPFERPSKLAFEYLRRSGKAAVQATLEKLDLVNHRSENRREDRILAKVWPHRKALIRFLRDQSIARDHSWGGNVASAAFAAIALALADEREAWKVSADYVRRHWRYDASLSLPAYHGAQPSPDADDFFVHIRSAMRAEDESSPIWANRRSRQSAESINMDRFHRTWMLGILLTFENTAMLRDPGRAELLKAIAGQAQLASGAFYPERVPWLTARVLNGLWHGGDSRDTSAIVRDACEWLRRPVDDGGPFDGRWRSGTGSWNSDVLTTAMCMTALLHAGVPASDRCIRAGYGYLKEQMPEWRQPGREIDCAAAAEAIMLAGPDRREIYPAIVDLLIWVGNGDGDGSVGEEESMKIPYVAEQVVWIVQGIVQRELEALLQDFEPSARIAGASRGEAVTPADGAVPIAAAGPPATRTLELRDTGDDADADADGEAETDAATRRAVTERLERLGREITANITSREAALRGRNHARNRRPIEAQLAIWLNRKNTRDEAAAQFAENPLSGVAVALVDRLWAEVFGHHGQPSREP
ncbi:hypothetical protein [Catenulispora subtropica]|uniref:AAA+ ATPase domain-containing protein n=1 Tax=Catenulispora subtropica TaxID=450798 RepID=A0ABN2TGI8_9ACTN